jgi:hypothetical protein
VVGTGGSVIDFDITDRGIGYANGDVLTVAGIPTDPNVGAAFSAFTFTVDQSYTDKFSGFSFGQLLPLYDFSDEFNGSKKVFTIRTTLTQELSTLILMIHLSNQLQTTYLLFLNDVLQQPGENYIFNGGTKIEFTEAPKSGSKLQILFFRGSNTDVMMVNPTQLLKLEIN